MRPRAPGRPGRLARTARALVRAVRRAIPGMSSSDGEEIRALLRRLPAERDTVEPRLLELLGGELRELAGRLMRKERADHTLQPTVLVDEAWMRVAGQRAVQWEDESQFLALAAQAMRRLLINHARDRAAAKRGGGRGAVELQSVLAYYDEKRLDVLALHDALEALAADDADAARLVELRFFGGLSLPDAARVMGIAQRSAERLWTRARIRLEATLAGGSESV